LDGGEFGKALPTEVALQQSGEGEFRKSFHLAFEGGKSRADYLKRREGVADQLPEIPV
jgi:hypothetical protein